VKQTIFCMGAAFLLLACQVAGYRSEASAPEIAAGKASTVKIAASGDGGPPASGKVSSAPAETVNAAGLKLPATFKGTLPCADCEGIRYTLIFGRMGSSTCVMPGSEPLWSKTK